MRRGGLEPISLLYPLPINTVSETECVIFGGEQEGLALGHSPDSELEQI